MRAALDATPLSVPTGGIRRYVQELSRALTETFPEDQYVLVSDQPFDPVAGVGCLALEPRGLDRKWWAFGLSRTLARIRADVFHGTDFAVPYLPLRPSVMTLHDLSPWAPAPWQATGARVRSRTPALLGFGIATMVITPTEAVRREAIVHFKLHPARVVAIPHGGVAGFRQVAAPASRTKPYFLHVGTLEPRKNVELLIRVWREVRRSHDVELVLAGRVRESFRLPPAGDGLVMLGQTPEADLPALYSGALAFLCASHYEGFGLPVLEAMQCGAPVIASLDPAIAEVAGSAAQLLSVRDPRPWVEAMTAAVGNPEWRATRRERSLARAAQFSWTQAANATREVYREAICRFAR